MNPKTFSAMALAVAAITAAIFVPNQSVGQAGGDDPALTAVVAEVAAQQTIIADNHAKIDTKIAAVGENIRLARIYAGRSR
jgi:hypothetical protein